jgi:hypothetical protein
MASSILEFVVQDLVLDVAQRLAAFDLVGCPMSHAIDDGVRTKPV